MRLVQKKKNNKKGSNANAGEVPGSRALMTKKDERRNTRTPS